MFKKLEHCTDVDNGGVLTYPYHYSPHPSVIEAASLVGKHLDESARNQAGRLVAVLVCRLADQSVGFITACDQFDAADPYSQFLRHERESSHERTMVGLGGDSRSHARIIRPDTPDLQEKENALTVNDRDL